MNQRTCVSDPKVLDRIFKRTSLGNIRLNIMEIMQGGGPSDFPPKRSRRPDKFPVQLQSERMPFQLLQLANRQARYSNILIRALQPRRQDRCQPLWSFENTSNEITLEHEGELRQSAGGREAARMSRSCQRQAAPCLRPPVTIISFSCHSACCDTATRDEIYIARNCLSNWTLRHHDKFVSMT